MNTLILMVAYGNWLNVTKPAIDMAKSQGRLCVWNNDPYRPQESDGSYEIYNSPANILWSPAVNAGIKHFWKGEEFICVMNNDLMLWRPGIIDGLRDALVSTGAGMVGPVGYGLSGPQSLPCKYTEPFPVHYLVGAITLFRKSVYDEIGPLDEDMALGADDFDYSLRMNQAGYQNIVVPSVVVNHRLHMTGESGLWEQHGEKSWDAFTRKWHGTELSPQWWTGFIT